MGHDGKLVAFIDHPQPSDDGGAVAVVDLSGDQTKLPMGGTAFRGWPGRRMGKKYGLRQREPGATGRLYASDLAGKVGCWLACRAS